MCVNEHANRNWIIPLCNILFFVNVISFLSHYPKLFFITRKYFIERMFPCVFNQKPVHWTFSLCFFAIQTFGLNIGVYFKLFIKYLLL